MTMGIQVVVWNRHTHYGGVQLVNGNFTIYIYEVMVDTVWNYN